MRIKSDVKLQEHQQNALSFCMARSASLVSYGTGTGKSLIMISLSLDLINSMTTSKAIIVVTASSIISLEEDIEKFVDKPEYDVINNEDDLYMFLTGRKQLALMKYNAIRLLKDKVSCVSIHGAVQSLPNGLTLCYDEVHAVKSPKSITTKSHRNLRCVSDRCYGFTATALTKDLFDLFYVVDFICPHSLGSFWSFRSRYIRFHTWNGHMMVDGYKNLDLLELALSNIQVTYFPKKDVVFIQHPCILTKIEEYHEAAQGYLDTVEQNKYDDEDEEEMYTGQKQHSVRLIDLQYVVNSDPAKKAKLADVVKEYVHQGCIIYCSYYNTIEHVKEVLDLLKIEYDQISGDRNITKRKDVKDWFNEDPSGKCLILTKAGGQSLNLQSCPCFIFMDTPQNPAVMLQAMGRIVRIGSKFDKFFINFIVCEDTIDQYKYDYMCQHKEALTILMHNEALPSSKALSGYNSYIINKLKRKYLWNK